MLSTTESVSPTAPAKSRRRRTALSRVAAETSGLVALAAPLVAGLMGGSLLSVVDSYMLGPLGEAPLAACSLTQSVLVIFYAALYGLTSPISVLVGQAYAAGELSRISAIRRHGLAIGIAGGLVAAVAMSAILALLPYSGQPENVVAILPAYWLAMSAALVPFTLQMVLKQVCDAIERPWTGAFFTILPVAVNVPLNWALIYGHWGAPKLGLLGAGLGSLGALTVGLVAMVGYFRFAKSMAPYRGSTRFTFASIAELTRHGTPMSVQYLAESSAVAIAGVLIGLLGATALAANQIVFSIGVLIYMVPLGMAGAVTIRIAQAIGECSWPRVRAIGIAGVAVVTIWMAAFSAAMVLFGQEIAHAFIDDPHVVALAATMFVAVGVMQVFDGLQSVSLGALRGMLDNDWPMRVSLIAYWLVALPLSVVFGFVLGFGATGVWAGFGAGLAVAGVLLTHRFLKLTSGAFN